MGWNRKLLFCLLVMGSVARGAEKVVCRPLKHPLRTEDVEAFFAKIKKLPSVLVNLIILFSEELSRPAPYALMVSEQWGAEWPLKEAQSMGADYTLYYTSSTGGSIRLEQSKIQGIQLLSDRIPYLYKAWMSCGANRHKRLVSEDRSLWVFDMKNTKDSTCRTVWKIYREVFPCAQYSFDDRCYLLEFGKLYEGARKKRQRVVLSIEQDEILQKLRNKKNAKTLPPQWSSRLRSPLMLPDSEGVDEIERDLQRIAVSSLDTGEQLLRTKAQVLGYMIHNRSVLNCPRI